MFFSTFASSAAFFDTAIRFCDMIRSFLTFSSAAFVDLTFPLAFLCVTSLVPPSEVTFFRAMRSSSTFFSTMACFALRRFTAAFSSFSFSPAASIAVLAFCTAIFSLATVFAIMRRAAFSFFKCCFSSSSLASAVIFSSSARSNAAVSSFAFFSTSSFRSWIRAMANASSSSFIVARFRARFAATKMLYDTLEYFPVLTVQSLAPNAAAALIVGFSILLM
mmetsp:Transcript_26588/g.32215  ORF Transcript_26588/g.32215 Transcript_26588/m.32215 type:complete len:220 (-) Transcript_26588:74-733(-)